VYGSESIKYQGGSPPPFLKQKLKAMIVKKNFNPLKVVAYTWQALLFSFLLSLAVFLLYQQAQFKQIALPFMIVGYWAQHWQFFWVSETVRLMGAGGKLAKFGGTL
jgi:hypothetical protein